MAMDSFPTFFTVRAITFACIVLLALIWLILVSVEVFTRWSISDNTSQSLMFLLILTNAITIFIPPFLSILEFRIWLDAARLLLMFVLQTGAATAFTCWSPQIQCPNQSSSDIGVCKLLNAYTVMGSWIIPVILLLYSLYFAVLVYMQSRIPVTAESPKIVPSSARPSVLPIMDPEMGEKRYSTSPGPLDSGPNTPNRSSPIVPPLLPLILPRRQSTLPVQNQSVSTSPQRHKSLPAIHRIEGGSAPQRTMTLSIPAPLAPQSQFQPVPRPWSNLQPGAVGSWPVARHLSMMPAPRKSRFPSEARRPSVAESPTARSVLSKQVPSYLM